MLVGHNSNTIVLSLAEEARDPTVSISKACSDRRSREDKYNYSLLTVADKIYA